MGHTITAPPCTVDDPELDLWDPPVFRAAGGSKLRHALYTALASRTPEDSDIRFGLYAVSMAKAKQLARGEACGSVAKHSPLRPCAGGVPVSVSLCPRPLCPGVRVAAL